MLRVFIATALIVSFWGLSVQAQEKKTVVMNALKNNAAGCDPEHTYILEIFPDKVISTIATTGSSGQSQTIPINADGAFRKEYKSGNRNLPMRIEGSIKTRQVRVTMLAAFTCTWNGTF